MNIKQKQARPIIHRLAMAIARLDECLSLIDLYSEVHPTPGRAAQFEELAPESGVMKPSRKGRRGRHKR